MIPTNLVLSIAAAREDVPFPAVIEALFTEIIFEALREAGIRLPETDWPRSAFSGHWSWPDGGAARALFRLPLSLSSLSRGLPTFTIYPRYSFANGIRLLRFPMLILAGTLGLYGIVLGFLAILLHVVSLRSFGVPYFTPMAPLSIKGLMDVVVRPPKTPKPTSNQGKQ